VDGPTTQNVIIKNVLKVAKTKDQAIAFISSKTLWYEEKV
jgi:hypothetical protein